MEIWSHSWKRLTPDEQLPSQLLLCEVMLLPRLYERLRRDRANKQPTRKMVNGSTHSFVKKTCLNIKIIGKAGSEARDITMWSSASSLRCYLVHGCNLHDTPGPSREWIPPWRWPSQTGFALGPHGDIAASSLLCQLFWYSGKSFHKTVGRPVNHCFLVGCLFARSHEASHKAWQQHYFTKAIVGTEAAHPELIAFRNDFKFPCHNGFSSLRYVAIWLF